MDKDMSNFDSDSNHSSSILYDQNSNAIVTDETIEIKMSIKELKDFTENNINFIKNSMDYLYNQINTNKNNISILYENINIVRDEVHNRIDKIAELIDTIKENNNKKEELLREQIKLTRYLLIFPYIISILSTVLAILSIFVF